MKKIRAGLYELKREGEVNVTYRVEHNPEGRPRKGWWISCRIHNQDNVYFEYPAPSRAAAVEIINEVEKNCKPVYYPKLGWCQVRK